MLRRGAADHYGLFDRENEAGRAGGMWVEPAWKRRGVGRALLRLGLGPRLRARPNPSLQIIEMETSV